MKNWIKWCYILIGIVLTVSFIAGIVTGNIPALCWSITCGIWVSIAWLLHNKTIKAEETIKSLNAAIDNLDSALIERETKLKDAASQNSTLLEAIEALKAENKILKAGKATTEKTETPNIMSEIEDVSKKVASLSKKKRGTKKN